MFSVMIPERTKCEWTEAMLTATHKPFDFTRFVKAQSDTYSAALGEIRQGYKKNHWMWFIFPQLYGLGTSDTANRYGIRSRDEAAAYLVDPLLGARFRECVSALQDLDLAEPEAIFGPVDARKLQSSLSLFVAAGPTPLFTAALDRWYGGRLDKRTVALINDRCTLAAGRAAPHQFIENAAS